MCTIGGLPGMKEVAELCPVLENNMYTGKGVFCKNEQEKRKIMLMNKQALGGPFLSSDI